MQVTINIPDDLPSNIVQQYISTIEMQMALIGKLTTEKHLKTKGSSLKRGSAKQQITFIADDFCDPLVDFQDYMQ
ncbi:MAG: hypothetical protein Q8Q50_11680 [Methylobacter sp.]|jgi:hypothetical protein|nr:hypothetical protein [Methylobacter sp.]